MGFFCFRKKIKVFIVILESYKIILRTSIYKSIIANSNFKNQLLHWSNQFSEVVFLDSNSNYNLNKNYFSYDYILAVEAFTSIKTDYHNSFQDLYQYQSQTKDWLFGYLSYDLKNDVEDLKSNNFDGLQFPDLYFFNQRNYF